MCIEGEVNYLKMKTQKRKKKKLIQQSRFYLLLILFVSMIAFIVQAWNINLIPLKFMIPVIVIIILIGFLMWWLQFGRRIARINKVLGKVLIIIFTILFLVGNFYIFKTDNTLSKVSVSEGDKEFEHISVVVRKNNKAKGIEDVKDSTFAIPKSIDEKNTNATIKELNRVLKAAIKTKTYPNNNDQAKALLDDKVDAIILNEAYRSLLDEKFPSFEKDTKVIYTYKIEKEVKGSVNKVDVLKDSFNIYISGIDIYGPIATKSRSDVNMIATINPNTNTVLLTSVPRDYYIPQDCQDGEKDKLTHSGIFGVNCTIDSMSKFTNLTFNYYARVNYSSMERIVNAIGGIKVYNQMTFRSGVDGTLIRAGNLQMNGKLALKFSRERKAYEDGDLQRGRNQMLVLEAIIKKAVSPSIITGYANVMDAIGDSFQTNMTEKEMTTIIKNQLETGANWKILQQSVKGTGETAWSPANGFNSYVLVPDKESLDKALLNIDNVMKGNAITIE